jgi:thiamine biosynthesis lipoprotein ApbE
MTLGSNSLRETRGGLGRRRSGKEAALLAFGILCSIVFSSARAVADEFVFYHENVMGTSLELAVAAESTEAARWAETRALSEIDRLSAVFSGYDDQSEFSRWQRMASRTPIPVCHELFDVFTACDQWGERSGWAFDPRVDSLTRLWTRCAKLGRVPDPRELENAKAPMTGPAWKLDPAAGTATRTSDCPLSLNGIAKGYIVELACSGAFDSSRGVRGVMLNVGGDLSCRGKIPRTIGIAAPWADSESSEPLAYLSVANCSVATSGNSQRGFAIRGRWYSHIIDPRTGLPVEHVSSATVIAPKGVDADALAKVCNVLEPSETIRLANSLEGVACLIVTRRGELVHSAGWDRYERAGPLSSAVAASAFNPSEAPRAGSKGEKEKSAEETPTAWLSDFEVVVNYEINRPEAPTGRYRRPYLAVWVENKDGFQVRTLVLWVSFGGAGPFQWLPDLKRWHKSDRDRKLVEKKEILFTVSRPTRQPGKYKVIWDGKDNNGKQLGSGVYTICIDAAREHGTYQSIRKQVTLGEKPFIEELEGNVEIKSASIEYRRKAAPK